MHFDYRTFFRVLYLSFCRPRLAPTPMTAKRIIFLIGFFLVFPIVALINGVCFWIDRICYPKWRNGNIQQPVFIVGNPRSGTTFIHRVMARDEQRFFCFKTWEIIFPAIIQKRFFTKVDRITGHVPSALIKRLETRLFREFNKMHKVSLLSPEEDDYLFLHIFSSHDLVWLFPFDEMKRFLRFDEMLKDTEQRRIMEFYKDCIKRQAYYQNHGGSLLSKAPASSARIVGLRKQFPDCKIIYMVRNPLEVIPSMINLAHEVWTSMAGMTKGFPLQDQIYDTLKYYYEYPLSLFEELPHDSYRIVNYEDLVKHPAKTIEAIYEHFGFAITPDFRKILQEEEHNAKNYKSGHHYHLDQTHMEREQIVADLQTVFDRFGFDKGEGLVQQ